MSPTSQESPPPEEEATPTTDDMSSLAPIHRLPPELVDSLLLYVPADQLQYTSLNLKQVFPQLAISERHLFTHLRVGRPEQLRPMWERLRRERYGGDEQEQRQDRAEEEEDDDDERGLLRFVESFTLACFSGDADLMNNVLRLIPAIRRLSLNLGTNFAPEHLAEAFQVERKRIEVVEVRFRPYVDRATYYQFLKGSYFDTAIETITRTWPETPTFRHLSIVQDVPPRFSVPHLVKRMARVKWAKEKQEQKRLLHEAQGGTVGAEVNGDGEEKKRDGLPSSDEANSDSGSEPSDDDEAWDALADAHPVEPKTGYTGQGPFPYLSGRLADAKPSTFAQPVVFHDITCLARLARSPGSWHVRDLRLRCPGRDVVKTLSEGGDTPHDAQGRRWFPRLRYLDVSTSNVRLDGWLPVLLRRYNKLEHIVLDRTNLFGFRGKDSGQVLCADLARMCAGMVGIQRAKERERELTRLEEVQRRREAVLERERQRRISAERPIREENEGEEDGENDEDDEEELEFDENGDPIERPPRPRRPVPEPEPEPEPIQYRAMERARPRRNRRTIAVATFSVRENSRRNRTNDRAGVEDDADLVIPPPQSVCMVLPSLSRLKSVNLGGESLPLDQTKLDAWEKGFRAGWKDGIDKAYEWATRVGERYDRAIKAAEAWKSAEQLEFGQGSKTTKGKRGPSPLLLPNGKPRTRPPLDVRLYRYPWPQETIREEDEVADPDDPYAGLIRVETDENWKDVYLRYLGEAGERSAADATIVNQDGRVDPVPKPEISSSTLAGPVLCCIPDCEGPMRRGDGGERVDGRAGMKLVNGRVVIRGGFKHKPGCGHAYAVNVWSNQV